ncbi:hypothetical protein B224_5817 [Aeromonas media WS]|nr:hypothetical protein B224_5817 [Aeromonas media WS]
MTHCWLMIPSPPCWRGALGHGWQTGQRAYSADGVAAGM